MTEKPNKYRYYKIIQTNSGYGWDDDDFHETNSKFVALDRALFKENLQAYRDNSFGVFNVRVVSRRELNEVEV